MRRLIRILAALTTAGKLPAPDYPPSHVAKMVEECRGVGREDLGEKILAQWAKVLEKYPQTRLNWPAAVKISDASIKKNVFGGVAFVEWLAKEAGKKPAELTEPKVEAPKAPAIAVPKDGETPEAWAEAAKETARMLEDAGKAFASVDEFMSFVAKEIGELKRKIDEYAKPTKSGKPHAFAPRIPKWQAQLAEYEKKLVELKESTDKSKSKFAKTAKDYDHAKVTTVAFEEKVQDSLINVLETILKVEDVEKRMGMLQKFSETLREAEKKSAANVTAADIGEFLAGLWDKVTAIWSAVLSWAKSLAGAVHEFSSIVHIADSEAEAEVVAETDFSDADVFDIAEALNFWLQHNWEGQDDELYKAYCELTKPGNYKPSPHASFDKMSDTARAVYDELTRSNYKKALQKVLDFDADAYDKEVNSSAKSMTCEEFFDTVESDICEYIDEMYWEDAYSSDKLFDYLKKEASKEGVTLTDEADWDYDDFFWNVYQSTEKGLS